MRIRVGMTSASVYWEEVLRQEGVDHGTVDVLAGVPPDSCSVLLVSAPLRPEAVPAVRAYLAGGGGVLGAALHLAPATGLATRTEAIRYLAGTGEPPFASVGLLDLHLRGDVPREANRLRTQADTFGVFAGERGGGIVAALPFDLRDVMQDARVMLKAYPFPADRLPAERVSLIARNEVAHLVHDALEYLHHARGVPYAHLWPFPGEAAGVLGIRIDTDRGTPGQVDTLYRIARARGMRFTWFLDVGSHAPWLERFAAMEGQEFGVHCYEHRVAGGTARDRADLDRARSAMEAAGIPVAGYAAPYGFWSPEQGLMVEAAGMPFSSEFACAADGLPFWPVVGYRRLATLQVPVHPVGAGAMRRAGYTEQAMVRYVERLRRGKLRRREPLFFYHHPRDEAWSCVEALCEGAQEPGVRTMCLGDYARWWTLRSAAMPSVTAAAGTVRIAEMALPETVGELRVRVSRPDGARRLIPPGGSADTGAGGWSVEPSWSPPWDLRRLRDFDLRTSIAGVYTAWQRRRR